MNNNVFDEDNLFLNELKKRLLLVFLIFLIIMVVLLLMIHKKQFYQNSIFFDDLVTAHIIVDKAYLDFIKENTIYLNHESHNYSIKKIEEQDDWYLVTITFPYEIHLNSKYYMISLGEESILNYISRVMKGG